MLPSEQPGVSLVVFIVNCLVVNRTARIRFWRDVIQMAAVREIIKAILIDLSGTLHIENTAIPGAVDALKRYVKCASAVG